MHSRWSGFLQKKGWGPGKVRVRSVIHLNVADFAVEVERQLDCRLRRRPVIIAPEAAVRASVYDMSEEAYQEGVRKGMPLRQALRFCSGARVLPPHFDRYERAMAVFLKRVLPFSPVIEVADQKGHLFMDVTGTGRLFGPPPDIAWRIRKIIRSDMGLDPIWSVAGNKLVAKVATRLVKPSGEYIVRAGDEETFLKPLPLYLMPGISADDLKQLGEFNLSLAGQVAELSVEQLDLIFGRRSLILHNAVRGIDPSPVEPMWRKKPVIRFDHEFGNDTNKEGDVEGALYGLVEKAGAKLRRQRLAAGRFRVVLDYSDGKRTIRHASAKPPAADDFSLFAASRLALKRAWTRRVRIRHIRLICDRFVLPSAQLELFAVSRSQQEKKERLMAALDTIRNRFGSDAVQMGRMVSKDAA